MVAPSWSTRIHLGAGCTARLAISAPVGASDKRTALLTVTRPGGAVSGAPRAFAWSRPAILGLDDEGRRICAQAVKAGAPAPLEAR